MDTKSKRWTLRVTQSQDTIVRQVLAANGMSLNEYVVSSAVSAAASDLADRRVFSLDSEGWDELQAILDRPPAMKERLSTLVAEPSVLEEE